MFFTTDAAGKSSPLELSGVGAREEIKNLQRSLAKLAKTAKRPQANPGASNGIIGESTMVSVGALLDHLVAKLPEWVSHPLTNAMQLGVSSTEAKNTVGRYVTEIRWAADTAQNDLWAQVPAPPSFSLGDALRDMTDTFFTDGWYTMPSRWMILGGIGLVMFAIVKHGIRK